MYKKTQTANDILPTPETCDRNIRLHSMHGKPGIFISYAEKDYENFMNSMGDNYGSRNPIYQAKNIAKDAYNLTRAALTDWYYQQGASDKL